MIFQTMNPEKFDDHRPDRRSFEKYRETKSENEEELDSTVDRLSDAILMRARCYAGGIPTTSEGFAKTVASIARASLTVESVSGLIMGFIADSLSTIRIQTVGAVLSLVKASNPHLTIDVIEYVFGLSNEKEADIARRHHIDRQVVNKRVVKMRRLFGLETPHKKKICEVYKNNRIEQYESARQKLLSIKHQ